MAAGQIVITGLTKVNGKVRAVDDLPSGPRRITAQHGRGHSSTCSRGLGTGPVMPCRYCDQHPFPAALAA